MAKVYITTTLPYGNASPHFGHAVEFIQADARKKYEEAMGNEVFLNIGMDEYGTKIVQAAKKNNLSPRAFVDVNAERFFNLLQRLDIHPTRFIRTTDEDHTRSAQKMWELCEKNGDIYKKPHTGTYCTGCELFVKEEDLKDGECPLHPGVKLETISEENYFFRFSKYKEQLLNLYEKKDFIVPEVRQKELKKFVSDSLEDFSISRSKERLDWGVPIPGDDTQVMYVWFDALTNYLTTIGWPEEDEWKDWWPVIQLAGKDNLRQQGAIWQAMLLSAGVEPSKQIFIHGFTNVKGQKMSKTVGNVIDPNEIINRFGVEFLRLFILKHIHPYEDSDIDDDYIQGAYDADMVNGIGNLSLRILTLAENNLEDPVEVGDIEYDEEYKENFEKFNYRQALIYVFEMIKETDKRINDKEPFKMVKTDINSAKEEIKYLVLSLAKIAKHLETVTPKTSEIIFSHIKENKKPDILFERR